MREDASHYEYQLDNEFFSSIDAPEIQKGRLAVSLDVRKSIGVFVLTFHTSGIVLVPCDRCLDDMEIAINTNDTLKVKLGASYSDEDDIVVVPEEDGYINVAWFIYEFIALSLPIKHVHAPGKCNKEMMNALSKHLSTDASEADDESYGSEMGAETNISSDEDDKSEAGHPTDPRWDGLKKILNNNK